jgi:hypothetical protein
MFQKGGKMVSQDDLKSILNGPHKFVNGQYVSTVPTQQEIDEAENKRHEAIRKAELQKVLDSKKAK